MPSPGLCLYTYTDEFTERKIKEDSFDISLCNSLSPYLVFWEPLEFALIKPYHASEMPLAFMDMVSIGLYLFETSSFTICDIQRTQSMSRFLL